MLYFIPPLPPIPGRPQPYMLLFFFAPGVKKKEVVDPLKPIPAWFERIPCKSLVGEDGENGIFRGEQLSLGRVGVSIRRCTEWWRRESP